MDFGLRRAHGAEAGLLAARATYLAGMSGTATVLAGKLYGVPLFGTMAHSFIQAHDSEMEAFESYARSHPDNITFLIDTYDTEAAAQQSGAARAQARARRHPDPRRAPRQRRSGRARTRSAPRSSTTAGLHEVKIFASGGIDEFALRDLLSVKQAPIDGFGIGSGMDASYDVPTLDCAYKLQEYAGRARRKRSEGKATWPGRKQVYRSYGGDGRMSGDLLTLDGDVQPGEPLLHPSCALAAVCPVWKRSSRRATARTASWRGCPKRCARSNPHPLTRSRYPTHSRRWPQKSTANRRQPRWGESHGGGVKPSPATTLRSRRSSTRSPICSTSRARTRSGCALTGMRRVPSASWAPTSRRSCSAARR